MLDFAIKYEQQVQALLLDTAYNEKYKYMRFSSWVDKWKPAENTWEMHEFVSVHNGKILGFMRYSIDRDANIAYGVQIASFTDQPSIIFGRDLERFLRDVFEKFKIRKLKFSVAIGNPIERSYDRWIEKYDGRIVGIQRQNDKLFDGTYVDVKMYEVFRDDYLNAIAHE